MYFILQDQQASGFHFCNYLLSDSVNRNENPAGTLKELILDLGFLPANSKGYVITDGNDSMSFSREMISVPKDKKMKVTIKENGGFVMVVK